MTSEIRKPLVSILIPAFNAEKWIADAIRSAQAQTWEPKEIIVVDDGSTDQTRAIAQRFESGGVRVIAQENQGAAAARNKAFSLSQGDYIQWLDADDILAPDKVALQIKAVGQGLTRRTLLASAWGRFFYRCSRAEFVPTALWCDLSPTEWLIRKLGQNLYMPDHSWLISRELSEAAGPWDTNLAVDDDGEYLCRVLVASDGVRFIPEATVYYRASGSNSVSHIGRSERKMEAQHRSMLLHIGYLRSLEDSQRVRAACVTYLQNWLIHFYPDRLDIVKQIEEKARELGGQIVVPRLSWKYSWIGAAFGWKAAKHCQRFLRSTKWSLKLMWDKVFFRFESLRFLNNMEKENSAHSPRLGRTSRHVVKIDSTERCRETITRDVQEPLVSILIPAFNAQKWIAGTLRSAIAQTWPRKEIIVADDGSTDRTVEIARQFESEGVRVVAMKNAGAAAARNTAYSLSRGDYVQWLDADDLLAPDKISRQMEMLGQDASKRTLLSSEWGRFIYRHDRAKFTPTGLWRDLSPLEWLLCKMGDNVYMQTASWLVSRELTEAAGSWDTRLLSDDDGEYFCRVLLASDSVRFVPNAKVYYRGPGLAFRSLSYIGSSDRKIDAHWLSMRLHIDYLRSLEDSDRVREACLTYLRTSLLNFYPERPDIVREVEAVAKELGGQIGTPRLSWKYNWIKIIFGWHIAKCSRQFLLKCRWSVRKAWDYTMFRMEKLVGGRIRGVPTVVTRAKYRYQRVVARTSYQRPFAINPRIPVISFTFDDFPRSALHTGGAILTRSGVVGTYYLSLGLMGKQSDTGSMFVAEDLKALLEHGHELGCHTYGHCHAWNTEPRAFEDAVVENRRALEELMPGASFKTHSYPISVPRPETKRRVSKYFPCCRAGGQTFNVGKTDLNYLSAYFLEQSRDSPEVIKHLIDENCRAGGWLVFATHDVCKEPTCWGCTPEFFEDIVQYSVNSGARILPVFQAYEFLRAGPLP